MKTTSLVGLLLVALPATADLDPALRRQLDRGGNAPVTVIVTMRTTRSVAGGGSHVERLAALADESQRELIASLTTRSARAAGVQSIKVTNAVILTGPPELVRQVADRGDVATVYAAEPVALVAPDGSRAASFGGSPTWNIERIGAPALWRQGVTGRGVLIGSLDSGVDPSHPALRGRLAGFRDFVNSRRDAYDDNGHGTHTLGTAAGAGGIGVAPEAGFLVAKVLDSRGVGDTADVLRAMDFMLDPDGDPRTDDAPVAVNNSWGGLGTAPYFQDAVANWLAAGITPVFAIGNHGPGNASTAFPGNYPHVLGVGALDRDDQVSRFSSRGPAQYQGRSVAKPDLVAPGADIVSALPGSRYGSFDGTSAAAPHITGAVALLKQAQPWLGADELRAVLLDSADDLGAQGFDHAAGAGRVNLQRCYERIGYRPGEPRPPYRPDYPDYQDYPDYPDGPYYDPYPPHQPVHVAYAEAEVRHSRPERLDLSIGVQGDPFRPLLVRLTEQEDVYRGRGHDGGRVRTYGLRADLSGYERWLDGRHEWYLLIEDPTNSGGQLLHFSITTAGGSARVRNVPAEIREGRRLRALVTPPPHHGDAYRPGPGEPYPDYRGTRLERTLPRYFGPREQATIEYRFWTDQRPPNRLTVTEQLPSGWRYVRADPRPLQVDRNGRITWRIDRPRDEVRLRLVVQAPDRGGVYRFSGEWQADDGRRERIVGDDQARLGNDGYEPYPDWDRSGQSADRNGNGRLEPWELLPWLIGRAG